MFNAFSAPDPRWIVLVAFSAGVCPCPAVVAKISENKTAAGKPQRAEDFKDMATGLRRGEGKAVFFFVGCRGLLFYAPRSNDYSGSRIHCGVQATSRVGLGRVNASTMSSRNRARPIPSRLERISPASRPSRLRTEPGSGAAPSIRTGNSRFLTRPRYLV